MWDTQLQKAFEILEEEDTQQRELWKIAFDIKNEFGNKGLREFSDNLKETYGITKSYNTLRQYAYVHEIVKQYKLPADLTYTAIRQIPTVSNPKLLISKIKNDGMSSAEVIRYAYEQKPKKSKTIACPSCGNEIKL